MVDWQYNHGGTLSSAVEDLYSTFCPRLGGPQLAEDWSIDYCRHWIYSVIWDILESEHIEVFHRWIKSTMQIIQVFSFIQVFVNCPGLNDWVSAKGDTVQLEQLDQDSGVSRHGCNWPLVVAGRRRWLDNPWPLQNHPLTSLSHGRLRPQQLCKHLEGFRKLQ